MPITDPGRTALVTRRDQARPTSTTTTPSKETHHVRRISRHDRIPRDPFAF
ncbi:hypothetical protein WCD74_15010 [Actinomycetospora sp. OC33-EN08]|uniref:Uncharacterized protein n=1 Tax=Actinomycetospora aurantiaca TaxID=3129233 RepID=A0ABU8MPJ6_9PSEU